jgi:hypothetical protein
MPVMSVLVPIGGRDSVGMNTMDGLGQVHSVGRIENIHIDLRETEVHKRRQFPTLKSGKWRSRINVSKGNEPNLANACAPLKTSSTCP